MKKRNRMIAGVICACMLLGNIEAPIVASAASSDEAYTLTSMQDDMDHEMEEDELEEVPGNVDETESAEDPEDWSGAENEGADQAEDLFDILQIQIPSLWWHLPFFHFSSPEWMRFQGQLPPVRPEG